jgi:hypothetical protein
MKKLIFSLFVLCLLLPSQAMATQFIPYDMGLTQPHNPQICVFDNAAGNDAMNMTQMVLDNISSKLDYLTHSHNWDMTAKLVDRLHVTDCNVTFVYTLQPQDPILVKDELSKKPFYGRILGYTICDGTTYGHPFCEIDIFLLNNDRHSLFPTAEHEFLHSLGLGHRQGDTPHDAMRAFLSDDLMYFKAKYFQHLTNEDLLALIHLYGTIGFHVISENEKPYSYIIPYPTHYKTYCNGVNGTICIQHF